MRILLFTGKGGVGKTTTAAGAAALAARQGRKTLVVSTDAAHSLSDALQVSAGPEPVEAAPGMFVSQVDPQAAFQRSWAEVRGYLVELLSTAGVDDVLAEELTVLPGAEEVLALLHLRDQVRSDRWDVIVVDCAPTAETLRLLSLPEALGWYMSRLFSPEHQVVRALRPVLGRVSGMPVPRDALFDAVARLRGELAEVREVLTAPTTSVRLVLTPEAVVVAEARRTLTSLSLFGYRVDGVVANRVFPGDGELDPWRQGWVRAQQRVLTDVQDSFAPLPVVRVPYCPAEPVGVQALADLAELSYGSADPFAEPGARPVLEVERSGEEFVLSLALPLADRDCTDLVRTGDQLVVTVGSARRVLELPSALRRCTVAGAVLREGRLRVRFEPDPALWMGL